MKLYPCKIDMFPLENMAFSRRCSFPSSSRWRSALRELQKSSIRSSRAESGEGNLVVDPKLPWIMESGVIFSNDLGSLLFSFLRWSCTDFFSILVDAFEWFFLQWFAPRDVCFRWHHTTHLWSRVEKAFKKNNTKFSKLSATFGSLRLKKKSLMKRSWKLLLKMRPAEC